YHIGSLTLIGDDHEHRLGPYLIDSLLSALSQVNSQSINGGSALITVACEKLFCNSFDVPWAHSARTSAAHCRRLLQMAQSFRFVIAKLISLPILTVAAVFGHAATAGLILCRDIMVDAQCGEVLYVSEKRGSLFILTLIGDDHEHRLGPPLIDSLLSALSQVKSQAINGGSALVTVAHGKFFCNGFNVPWGQSDARSRLHQMVESFGSVMSALLSLPVPTISAVSGHAAAGGLVLALGHDYPLHPNTHRRRSRAPSQPYFIDSLSLLSPKSTPNPSMVALLSSPSLAESRPSDYLAGLRRGSDEVQDRRVGRSARRVAERDKVKGEEAVRMGIVDSAAYDSEESVVEAAVRLGIGWRRVNGMVRCMRRLEEFVS
ncbi:enoyl-coa delta isomerase 3, partial [Quercus suber]